MENTNKWAFPLFYTTHILEVSSVFQEPTINLIIQATVKGEAMKFYFNTALC